MDELSALRDVRPEDLAPIEPSSLDPLYRSVLDNLHLEIRHEDVQYLISPTFEVIHPAICPVAVSDFVKQQRPMLEQLRPFLIHNLLAYSFLVETQSYYLQQNRGLMIARIKERDANAMRFEVLYYTNTPAEVVSHYSDKIYLGRDFVRLSRFLRPKGGLGDHIQSLLFEIEALKEMANLKLHEHSDGVDTCLADIESIGDEFIEHGMTYLESLPASFVFEDSHDKGLLTGFLANARRLKHFLIEIDSDLEELSMVLRERDEPDFRRYVVKFRSDIHNLIELFNVKLIAAALDKL